VHNPNESRNWNSLFPFHFNYTGNLHPRTRLPFQIITSNHIRSFFPDSTHQRPHRVHSSYSPSTDLYVCTTSRKSDWFSGPQLGPQQLKYMTCRSESSACFLLSSPPMNPSNSDLVTDDSGRRSAGLPPAAVEEEEMRCLVWCKGLMPVVNLQPWSAWPFTTATVAAIQARFR